MIASVYIIHEDGGDSPVKIGWAANPKHRVSMLQIGNHRKLKILHARAFETSETAKRVENHLHTKFSGNCISGEWFAVTGAEAATELDTIDAAAIPLTNSPHTAAARIIAKFGTQAALGKALGLKPSAISRWQKSGFIPAWHFTGILAAAQSAGIRLTADDFFAGHLPSGQEIAA